MSSYSFRVFGIPAPQGSKIPGVSSKTGKAFVREQSSKTLVPWRQDVKEAALLARGDQPTIPKEVGVKLQIRFFMPRPPSVSVKKRLYPTVSPDLDKMVRGVGDALKQAGVYHDDAQVIGIQASKVYASEERDMSPGAWIVVSEIL